MSHFTIGQLKYTVTSATTVSVKAADSSIYGSITIPSIVTKDAITYSVTSIGNLISTTPFKGGAFQSCSGITSIFIP